MPGLQLRRRVFEDVLAVTEATYSSDQSSNSPFHLRVTGTWIDLGPGMKSHQSRQINQAEGKKIGQNTMA